jgi:bile acid:Na+ symporter, BASS family
MTLQQVLLFALKTSIALSVLALGLKSTIADDTYLLRRPALLVRAFLSMNVVMPVVALILALTLNLHPAVNIALIALSVSPVPPIFPKKAMKSGGREDYTIGLLVAAAMVAIIVVPLAIEIVQRISHIPLQMPARSVAFLVFTTILGPLLLGMILHAMLPAFAKKIARPLEKLASILLLVSVLPVLIVYFRTIISLIGNGTLLALGVFAVVGFASGYLLGGPEPENRQVLSLATATRHPGMAAAIAHTNFPDEKLVVPAILLYLIVATLLSALLKKASQSREAGVSDTRKAA